jgi:hypothetical protein
MKKMIALVMLVSMLMLGGCNWFKSEEQKSTVGASEETGKIDQTIKEPGNKDAGNMDITINPPNNNDAGTMDVTIK